MSTTTTDYDWYYYVRLKGRRRYIGLADENGDAPASAITNGIEIYYQEIPDEYTSDDDTFTVPPQYEMAIIKGVASEIMAMDPSADPGLARKYEFEYERIIGQTIHDGIKDSQRPLILKPLDLRDD